ncbi:MAG: biotin/lipoyl-binding protein [Oscillospiraceae bacterium]
MFKKFKKISLKKKIISITAIVIALLLVSWVLYSKFKPAPPDEYQITTVSKGDIQALYETKGTVESTDVKTYAGVEGVMVKSVNVNVGDRIKAGDVLATFDTAPAMVQLNNTKLAYDKAKKAYDKSLKTITDAKTQIPVVNSQINTTNDEIRILEMEIETLKAQEITTAPKMTDEQLKALVEQLKNAGKTQAEINEIIKGMTKDAGDAIANSLIGKQAILAQKKAQLTSLNTQLSINETQTDDTISNIYKGTMETKQKEYESLKAIIDSLAAGFVSTSDGIVTEINITAGKPFVPKTDTSSKTDLSSILGMVGGNSDAVSTITDILSSSPKSANIGTAMITQNYGEFIATFTVGKSDLLDLKVGQEAIISSLGSDYKGVVTYVSATASATTGFDISSIASSMVGTASSTSSSALIKVKIENPDEKIVIGFDVDIKVKTKKIENVLVAPVDSVPTLDGVHYVFTYNEQEGTVKKCEVKMGVFSENVCEILSGISEGDKIIVNPKTALLNGDKIAVKS